MKKRVMLERPTVQHPEQGCQEHARHEIKVKSGEFYTGYTFPCKNEFGQDPQVTNVIPEAYYSMLTY